MDIIFIIKKKKYIQSELNDKLAGNYKKRVENFIINMLENPLPITEYKSKDAKIREESPERFLGDP